jgi:iron complex transport system substrate-binding protein
LRNEDKRLKRPEDEKQPLQCADRRFQGMKITWFIVIPLFFTFLSLSATAETLAYKDKLDRTVIISVPVKRAVFFQTYELIPALGIWDRVVGIGRYAYSNDLMKAAMPDIRKKIPSAGSGIDVNIETLLRLQPDLVITWTVNPTSVRFMEARGIKVISLYPESLSELYEAMIFHGRVFRREKEMYKDIVLMEGIFSDIKKRVAGVPAGKKQKVLWIGSRPNAVACRIGVNNDIISMIGGVNPAAVIEQRNADVPIERIIAWNPDVIFIWGNATYGSSDIIKNPQWQSVKAVRSGKVYKAPEWSTWSPRLAPVALWMAMKIYPAQFSDINYFARADQFYKKVFGIGYNKVKRIEN